MGTAGLVENTPSPGTLLTRHYAVHCDVDEDCSNQASWNEETPIGDVFDIREAPFARGYFLGDYMGLANAGSDFLSGFGSTAGGGPSSIFVSRIQPECTTAAGSRWLMMRSGRTDL